MLGAVAIKGGPRGGAGRTDGRPRAAMAGALLEPHKLVPTPFEGQHFDPYDYYSLTERYSVPGGCSRKGRSKREAAGNTNRPSPAGHERKIALKLQRSERRRGQE